ncbi:MAG: alpha/beta fold hydrolase [Terracidiphilus sp.]
MNILDAPSSCRSCTFLTKCFGKNDESVARSTVLPNEWKTYPLQLGDTFVRVLSRGDKGPPIVFVHGPGGSADRWAFNLNAFYQAGYRALALDLPGHGLASKTPEEPFSVPEYARVLATFLDKLAEPAVLVGASVGAHIAAYCATQTPGRVKALVLVSGGGAIPLGSEHRERLRRIMTYRSREGGLERLRRCLFDPRLAAGDIVEQEFRLNTSPGAKECLHAFGDYIAEEIDSDVVGVRLQELATQIPCLVVWGADDKVLPSTFGNAMQAAIGGASQFIAIKNTGHAPYFERPWEFNQTLLRFLGTPKNKHETSDQEMHRESFS